LNDQFSNSSQDFKGSKPLPEKTKKDRDHVFDSVALLKCKANSRKI